MRLKYEPCLKYELVVGVARMLHCHQYDPYPGRARPGNSPIAQSRLSRGVGCKKSSPEAGSSSDSTHNPLFAVSFFSRNTQDSGADWLTTTIAETSYFIDVQVARERECSLLTTSWSESTLQSGWLGGPASRHGSLSSLFQVALHLPSQGKWPELLVPCVREYPGTCGRRIEGEVCEDRVLDGPMYRYYMIYNYVYIYIYIYIYTYTYIYIYLSIYI